MCAKVSSESATVKKVTHESHLLKQNSVKRKILTLQALYDVNMSRKHLIMHAFAAKPHRNGTLVSECLGGFSEGIGGFVFAGFRKMLGGHKLIKNMFFERLWRFFFSNVKSRMTLGQTKTPPPSKKELKQS